MNWMRTAAWLLVLLVATGAYFYYAGGGAGYFSLKEIGLKGGTRVPLVLPEGIAFGEDVPLGARAAISDKVAALRAAVEENPSDAALWSKLAMQYSMAGDFERCRAVWEHILTLAPNDVIALYSLGYLYQFRVRDESTAKDYYEAALAEARKSGSPLEKSARENLALIK
ncbi:MAG: hypothetical protein Q8Q36_00680 [bacterium]|nr:hypothetical protein [bacterium]